MKSGMIIGAVLACLFVAVFGGAPAPDSSADAEAEPSPTHLDSGTVEGLSRMAVLTGREAMQAVTIMRSYVSLAYCRFLGGLALGLGLGLGL